jgi:uncharacterized protein YjbI with pentapeptide repeats
MILLTLVGISLTSGLRHHPFLARKVFGGQCQALSKTIQNLLVRTSALVACITLQGSVSVADSLPLDLGASDVSNTKIQRGGASTLQAGIAKTITRGVNLDNSDFSGQNLKGVAFQQSIVRDASFKGANLYSASFFDATLDGSDFEDADMTLANVELAQFKRANFRNTIAKEMYVVGATNFEGIGSIENSDWTDTELSRAQRKYLCAIASSKGTNSKTGAGTRDSLLCD